MSIATATDWFLVQTPLNGKTCIWRIACWYDKPDGTVIGLVGVTHATGVPYLAGPPPTSGGTYKHLSEPTPEELQAVQTNGSVLEQQAPST